MLQVHVLPTQQHVAKKRSLNDPPRLFFVPKLQQPESLPKSNKRQYDLEEVPQTTGYDAYVRVFNGT